jgi:hypothetical protein
MIPPNNTDISIPIIAVIGVLGMSGIYINVPKATVIVVNINQK